MNKLPHTPKKASSFVPRVLTASLLALMGGPSLIAAEISKANNTTALNLEGSWVGGVVPGSDDIAVWADTLLTNRTANIGGNLSWAGIKVGAAGGGSTLHTIGNTNSATLTLGAAGIDMSEAGVDFTIAAVLDWALPQEWSVGDGRILKISGANIGTGALTLSGRGTVEVGNLAAFGTADVSLADGITLTKAVSGALALNNFFTLNGDVTLVSNNNNLYSFTGGLSLGSEDRTISLNNGNGSGVFAFAGGSSVESAKEITGEGALILKNANTGESPNRITVTFGSGTAAIRHVRVSSNLVIGDNVLAEFVIGALTRDSEVTVHERGILSMASGGSVASQVVGSLSGSGRVTKLTTGGGSATLTIDGGTGTGSTTFSGVIDDGSGSGTVAVMKTGFTTQTFSGENTYRGATTVSGGILLVNGTHIQSSAGSGYVVNSGGTLGGSGRISRFGVSGHAVSIASDGFLSPGDGGIGTLTLDGANHGGTGRVLNMSAGAQFNLDLAGDGSRADSVDFWNFSDGDLGLVNNAVNLSLTGPLESGEYTVSIFHFFSDDGETAFASTVTSGLQVGELGFGITSATISYNGSTIDVTYTVDASLIPEPSTYATVLGVMAMVGTALRRRRR